MMDSGYTAAWLKRGLRPALWKVDRRARRVKTDRVDAESLLRALQSWRRGDRARSCACQALTMRTLDGGIANLRGCVRSEWVT